MIKFTSIHSLVVGCLLSILATTANATDSTDVSISVTIISSCDLSIQESTSVGLGAMDSAYFDNATETESWPINLQVTGCNSVSEAHVTFVGNTVSDGYDGLLAIDDTSTASGIAVGISKVDDDTPIILGDDCIDCGIDVPLEAVETEQSIALFRVRVVDVTEADEKVKAGDFTAQMTVTISKP
ncbi:TPA: fimbrial protein [Vibrio parahaemolyticus]